MSVLSCDNNFGKVEIEDLTPENSRRAATRSTSCTLDVSVLRLSGKLSTESELQIEKAF